MNRRDCLKTVVASAIGGRMVHAHDEPHPNDPVKRAEHLAMLALVPREEATHVAIRTGMWNDRMTWRSGMVPNAASKVLVPAGLAVTIDGWAECWWLRVDGKLDFSSLKDSALTLDTWVCDAGSSLKIAPRGKKVLVTFMDVGPIDTRWDQLELSRGLIAHGTVDIFGEGVAPDHALARTWKRGQEPPVLERNITFRSDGTAAKRRGHIMFMHAPRVDVRGTRFTRLGRTDKSRVVTDPDGMGGGLDNVRGRYALHFHQMHRDGGWYNAASEVVLGCAVDDGVGWGIVNHSSHVWIAENTVYDIRGAGIVTERGDEIGVISKNVVLNCVGATPTSPEDSRGNFDFGWQGEGVWVQGGGTVDVSDNTIGACRASGIVYMGNESSKYRTAYLRGATWNGPSDLFGEGYMPSADVPLRNYRNYVHSCINGLFIWAIHNPTYHGTQGVVEELTVERCPIAINLGYTGHHHFKNCKLIGDVNAPRGVGVINTGAAINHLTYQFKEVRGFEVGLYNPCTGDDQLFPGATKIVGGRYSNKINIGVWNTAEPTRTLEISDVIFEPLSADTLSRAANDYIWSPGKQWNVRLVLNNFHWDIRNLLEGWGPMPESEWRKLFAKPSDGPSVWGMASHNDDVIKFNGEFLSFEEFGPTYKVSDLYHLPADIRFRPDGTPRTTAMLAQDRQMYMGGRMLPAGAYQKPEIRGWLHTQPANFK